MAPTQRTTLQTQEFPATVHAVSWSWADDMHLIRCQSHRITEKIFSREGSGEQASTCLLLLGRIWPTAARRASREGPAWLFCERAPSKHPRKTPLFSHAETQEQERLIFENIIPEI